MMLELYATPEEVMRAVEALRAFGQERGLGEKELFGPALALEECASNIVNHALERDARQTFRVWFEQTEKAMTIELRDGGPEFNPTLVPTGKAGSHNEDRPAGGWGLELVRHYMDELAYRREGGENVFRLIKRIGPPAVQEGFH